MTMAAENTTQAESQYSLPKILGIWVAAALPMAILGWVVHPALAPDFKADPLGAGVTRMVLMTVGLVWQFALAMIIVYKEEGDLRWATIRRRLWLNKPRDPKTGQPRGRLWLWVIPLIILVAALELTVAPLLNNFWVKIFPFFNAPPGFNPVELLESPGVQAQLVGAWWFLGLFLLLTVFNVFLGEEFIFRGVLLPKMEGAFGKWDWVVNGALMGAYHWHQPWGIPGNILTSIFAFSLPARRFRSTWMAVIVHSIQGVLGTIMILGLVLGLV